MSEMTMKLKPLPKGNIMMKSLWLCFNYNNMYAQPQKTFPKG